MFLTFYMFSAGDLDQTLTQLMETMLFP